MYVTPYVYGAAPYMYMTFSYMGTIINALRVPLKETVRNRSRREVISYEENYDDE